MKVKSEASCWLVCKPLTGKSVKEKEVLDVSLETAKGGSISEKLCCDLIESWLTLPSPISSTALTLILSSPTVGPSLTRGSIFACNVLPLHNTKFHLVRELSSG